MEEDQIENPSSCSTFFYYFGLVHGIFKFYPYKEIFSQFVQIDDLKCECLFDGDNVAYETIICSCFSKTKNPFKSCFEGRKEIQNIQQGLDTTVDFITLSSLLEINSRFAKEKTDTSDQIFISWNQDLISFYSNNNPEQKFSSLLRFMCGSSQGDSIKLHPICYSILLSLLENDGITCVIYPFFRVMLGSNTYYPEDQLFFLEELLKQQLELLDNLQVQMESTKATCHDVNLSNDLILLVTKNLVLTNSLLEKELNITAKTAISELRKLEKAKIMTSFKQGREKFYINCNLLKYYKELSLINGKKKQKNTSDSKNEERKPE